MIRLDDARVRLAEAVFRELVDVSPERRRAVLERRCGSDMELRALVQRLLDCDSATIGADDHSLLLHQSQLAGSPENAPLRVGRYQIVREIDRGGVGIVYEAHQASPQRRVALKILRFFAPGPEVLRRFQTEAEVLGRLNHPGIAQVYEAGVDEFELPGDHRVRLPFVAMEYIDGRPLTEFTAARQFALVDRLDLLARICDAVHHAHQKGVIHRDLKPANILIVSAESADADESRAIRPKIVDFGVARVTSEIRNRTVAQTQSGQLLGTLAYMSPEQLAGETEQIDTRSDVYSLGVIAHQLLTGRPPIDVSQKSLPQALDFLNRTTIPAVSTICPALRGDIEAIVAKATERDPERRYASAAEFAVDLRRYLQGLPVLARSAGPWYALRKVIARHRVEAAIAASSLLLLIAAVISLAVMNSRAVRGWDEARRQEKAASAASTAEHDARVAAETVNQFLHEMLAAASPSQQGHETTLLSVLEAATDRLDAGALRDQPVAEAAALTTLATSWQALGDYDRAATYFSRALETRRGLYSGDHADIATDLNHVGEALFLKGNYDRASECFTDALAMRQRLFGDNHPAVAECCNNLAFIARQRDRFDEGERLMREALRIWRSASTDESENIELGLHNLASVLSEEGRPADAIPILQEVYSMRLRRYGRDDHPLVVSTRNNLASGLDQVGRYDEAESLHRINLVINRRTLPAGHAHTRYTVGHLVDSLRAKRQFAEAEALLREEIGSESIADAASSLSLLELFGELGLVLTDLDRGEEAAQILKTVVEIRIAKYGEINREVATAMNNLADALADVDEVDAAIAMMERVLSIDAELSDSRENGHTATYLHHLASIFTRVNQCDRAVELWKRALAIRLRLLGEDHPLTRSTQHALQELGVEG